MLVLGEPGPDLGTAVDLVWSQVPHPGHRARIADEGRGAVRDLLDKAAAALVDRAGEKPAGGGDPQAQLDGDGDVAGLPMAGTAEDRDGLELDSLTVTLGPVLPAWPTGLVVRAAMQGDVLSGVTVKWLDGGATATSGHEAPARAAAADHLARFLEVAGWPVAARQARGVRSDRRNGGRLARRIRRSRVLAWSVRDIDGVLGRVYRWCDVVAGRGAAVALEPRPRTSLDALLDGTELAAARLIVASLDTGTLRDAVELPDRYGAGHG